MIKPRDMDAILAAIDWELEEKQGTKNKTLEMLKLAEFRSELVKKRLESLFGKKKRLYFDFNVNTEKIIKNPDVLDERAKKFFLEISKIIDNYEDLRFEEAKKRSKDLEMTVKNFKRFHLNPNDSISYIEGYVTNDKNQKAKIGSLLQKYLELDEKEYSNDFVKDMINHFNQRPSFEILKKTFKVCISQHPADVVAASSGQRWVSCVSLPGYSELNIAGGKYYETLKGDVAGGTIVAYLIEEGGENLRSPKPYARILAKPYILRSERQFKNVDVLLVSEEKVYSDGSLFSTMAEEFGKFFIEWLNQQKNKNLILPGEYKRQKVIRVETDEGGKEFDLYSDSEKMFEKHD